MDAYKLEITVTELASSIPVDLIHMIVEKACQKFADRAGKFNRYRIGENTILIYFESNEKATIMLYKEALELPILGDECREIWRE